MIFLPHHPSSSRMKRSREPEEEDDDEEQAQGPDPRVTQRKATTPLSMPGSPQRPPSKIPELDTAIDDTQDDSCTMRCSLPPHKSPISFSSYGDYETHYHQFHTNRCLECSKNFPSDHLLGVHIEEWHDPLVKVRRDKGEHTVSLTSCRVLFPRCRFSNSHRAVLLLR